MASGQGRSALDIGIADRSPNARVSYEAEHTTLRLPGRPPTISNGARPAPSGSTARATATKKASASARRMWRGILLNAECECGMLTQDAGCGFVMRDAEAGMRNAVFGIRSAFRIQHPVFSIQY